MIGKIFVIMIMVIGFFKIISSPDLAVNDDIREGFQCYLFLIFLGLLMLAIFVILYEAEGDYLVLAIQVRDEEE